MSEINGTIQTVYVVNLSARRLADSGHYMIAAGDAGEPEQFATLDDAAGLIAPGLQHALREGYAIAYRWGAEDTVAPALVEAIERRLCAPGMP